MPIKILTDLTIVTLRTNGQDVPQRWTPSHAQSVLRNASDLLRDRADIEFILGTCDSAVDEMPEGAAADTVDEQGYHFLVAIHKAGTGARVLLVDKVSREELGGQSRYQTRTCLIAYRADVATVGRMLAHELGHLLELPHVDNTRKAGPSAPGQEQQVAARMRNLMYSGALNPAVELTPAQVKQAQASALAQRFDSR